MEETTVLSYNKPNLRTVFVCRIFKVVGLCNCTGTNGERAIFVLVSLVRFYAFVFRGENSLHYAFLRLNRIVLSA